MVPFSTIFKDVIQSETKDEAFFLLLPSSINA